MDTQLSRFYLAAQPLHRLMVQFRANGSHQRVPADVASLRSATRLNPPVMQPIQPTHEKKENEMPKKNTNVNQLVVNAGLGEEKISPYIYGHFSEHLGRCIYGGIWVGRESSIPNTRGIRNDIVKALRKVNLPILRWPGGHGFLIKTGWRLKSLLLGLRPGVRLRGRNVPSAGRRPADAWRPAPAPPGPETQAGSSGAVSTACKVESCKTLNRTHQGVGD